MPDHINATGRRCVRRFHLPEEAGEVVGHLRVALAEQFEQHVDIASLDAKVRGQVGVVVGMPGP